MTSLLQGIQRLETGGISNPYGYVSPAGALGAYGIMPANLPQWGANAGYAGITPSQFLANPAAQDAIAQTQLNTYATQYGGNVASIGQAWLGGPGSVGRTVVDPYTGISTSTYGGNLVNLVGTTVTPTSPDGNNIAIQGDQSPNGLYDANTPNNYGDITGYQVGGVNAPYTTPTGATYDPTTGGFSDPSSMFGGAGGGIGGGGSGANIVTTSGQASGVAGGGDTLSATGTSQKMQWSDYGVAAVAQGSAAVANATSGAIKSVGSSITTWLGAQFSNVGQWFFRGVGVLFGIVLILGAFALMAFSGRRTA